VRILDLGPSAWAPAGTQYVNGSVLDPAAVHDALEDIDEVYHLAGLREHIPLRRMVEMVVAVRRRKGIHVRIPAGFAHMTAAKILADHVTRRPPATTVEGIRIAVRSKAMSSEKSWRELGYTPRPIEPTLQEAIEGIPGGSRWSVAGWRAAPLGRPIQEASGS
jgi:nucleoside-diphosphate-sugar epimerase